MLVILYLVLEYARPQDMLPALAAIHPGMILTLLMPLAWLGSGTFRRVASPQMYHMVLLLCLIAIHVPFATNNFWAYSVARGFLLVLPLAISIVLFVDTAERLRLLMKWWIFLAAFAAVRGILGRGIAGSSFLGDENDFSLLINVMLPFAFCLFLYERQWPMKLTCLGTCLLCAVSVVMSGSRGGFVGLIAAGAVLVLASPRRLLFLVVAGILALVVYVSADQEYWDDMATMQDTDQGTAKERLESWEAAWDMFKDNPLGVGPGNFPVRFPEYQPESMQKGMWGRQAHSLWFTLLAELGIPGLVLYLSLLRLNLRDLLFLRRSSSSSNEHRLAHVLSVAFMASLAGYFASGTFLSVLYYPHFWYLTAMIVATKKIVEDAHSSRSKTPGHGRFGVPDDTERIGEEVYSPRP